MKCPKCGHNSSNHNEKTIYEKDGSYLLKNTKGCNAINDGVWCECNMTPSKIKKKVKK